MLRAAPTENAKGQAGDGSSVPWQSGWASSPCVPPNSQRHRTKMTRWQHQNLLALRPFQKRFIRRLRPPNRFLTLGVSLPRGNGKSTLSAWLALQCLSPGSPLYQAGADHLLVAASLGQARRTTFAILRKMVEGLPDFGTDFRVTDNSNAARILHPPPGPQFRSSRQVVEMRRDSAIRRVSFSATNRAHGKSRMGS